MRLGALLSGGKDSVLATCHAAILNHAIACVLHLETDSEVDSYMIQSAGSQFVKSIAECMQVPYLGVKTNGKSVQKELYIDHIDEQDETQQLFELIKKAKSDFNLDGVISGAIESDYQRLRIEFICQKLGLTSFAPLWKSEPLRLFKELSIVDSKIIKVASLGLTEKHLGLNVTEIQSELEKLSASYQLHPLGEGILFSFRR
eukprot:NODE_38_length_35257_cov_0.939047.p19 type:complete len:202 gc:universal NODE_38_length_35257_cov_0.939047:12409-11804(-)